MCRRGDDVLLSRLAHRSVCKVCSDVALRWVHSLDFLHASDLAGRTCQVAISGINRHNRQSGAVAVWLRHFAALTIPHHPHITNLACRMPGAGTAGRSSGRWSKSSGPASPRSCKRWGVWGRSLGLRRWNRLVSGTGRGPWASANLPTELALEGVGAVHG